MIEARELTKVYGEVTALREASFSIDRGEIVGLLGPNGAGKTTAMKILTGYLLPTAGSATVAGHDVLAQPLEVQGRIGYLPENAPVYGEMRVGDYLAFSARMRGLELDGSRARVRRIVEECGIGDVLSRPIAQLSKGYRQRVGLAAAILHDPELLILDEPTTGLDPNQIVEVRQLIRAMGREKTVILSTHILPEVEATCSRAVILIDGRVRADGTLGELTRERSQVVTLAPGDPAQAREAFAKMDGVEGVEAGPVGADGFVTFRLHLAADRDLGEEVARVANGSGWPLRELRRDERSLEQVFRELTETAAEDAA
jgi:ABC-2 type transport system ATP-binding protein